MSGMHANSVTSVQFNPTDNRQVLTNGLDSCLKLIDIRTGSAIHTLRNQAFQTGQSWSASAFSSNGKLVYVISPSFVFRYQHASQSNVNFPVAGSAQFVHAY
jgi:WD40 repeat protein